MKTEKTKNGSILLMGVAAGAVVALFAVGCASHRNEAPPTLSSAASGTGQQVTGVLGSPAATTTISGTQLPPPPPEFGGVIKELATDSKTWWPPRVVPPRGAPNVLLIMTDDQGYGVSGT